MWLNRLDPVYKCALLTIRATVAVALCPHTASLWSVLIWSRTPQRTLGKHGGAFHLGSHIKDRHLSLSSHPMIRDPLFFYGFLLLFLFEMSLHSLHLACNESSDCNIFSGAMVVSEKFKLCNQFSSSRRHCCRLRSSRQDVVLWAPTLQAQGIGGWESCGQSFCIPTSSVVCWGKIPDREAEVFQMTKTIICLHPPLCSNMQENE